MGATGGHIFHWGAAAPWPPVEPPLNIYRGFRSIGVQNRHFPTDFAGHRYNSAAATDYFSCCDVLYAFIADCVDDGDAAQSTGGRSSRRRSQRLTSLTTCVKATFRPPMTRLSSVTAPAITVVLQRFPAYRHEFRSSASTGGRSGLKHG